MVFCKGTRRNLVCLINLFKSYGDLSGQHLSIDKCRFFRGSMCARRVRVIKMLLGFSAGMLPFIYLRVPIFKGKPRTIHLQPIADRIKARLSAWKGSCLSIMGRVQLVNSVINGMLIYSFHIYHWPVSLLKSVDAAIRNFVWSGSIHTRKLATVAWNKTCRSLTEGGLGLKSVRDINEAAMLKLSWDVLSSSSYCADFLRARLFKKNKVASLIKSSIWSGIKKFMPVVQSSVKWSIGDGSSINFWIDYWLDSPIADQLGFPAEFSNLLNARVKEFIANGSWSLPQLFCEKAPDVGTEIKRIVIPQVAESSDWLVWPFTDSGTMGFKDAFCFHRPPVTTVSWSKIIWKKCIPPQNLSSLGDCFIVKCQVMTV